MVPFPGSGTANDLATGLEIPTDPRKALEVALGSNDGYPIDLGLVNDQVLRAQCCALLFHPFLQGLPCVMQQVPSAAVMLG